VQEVLQLLLTLLALLVDQAQPRQQQGHVAVHRIHGPGGDRYRLLLHHLQDLVGVQAADAVAAQQRRGLRAGQLAAGLFLEEVLDQFPEPGLVESRRQRQQVRGAAVELLAQAMGQAHVVVTQLVVGAVGESDLEILTTTEYVTRQLRLRRVYFSAFNPVPDTPLESQPPENPWRQHRLYQASFLLRDYGFDLEDMPFTSEGRLPLEVDPKLGWAQSNLRERPVEVNRADRRELLRVPGIGPKGADAILLARRRGKLRELRDLQTLGVLAARAAPFILLDGKMPTQQLRLF